jgi:hypothetical protein
VSHEGADVIGSITTALEDSSFFGKGIAVRGRFAMLTVNVDVSQKVIVPTNPAEPGPESGRCSQRVVRSDDAGIGSTACWERWKGLLGDVPKARGRRDYWRSTGVPCARRQGAEGAIVSCRPLKSRSTAVVCEFDERVS